MKTNPQKKADGRRFAIGIVLASIGFITAVTLLRAADPWKSSQVVETSALASQLKKSQKPVVLQVGVKSLYNQAHVPGAKYCGPGSSQEGLDALKRCVEDLSRSQAIVIYCGCCPMKDCPNLRPAFEAMQKMNFTKVKVLDIPNNFGKDWVDKGLPTEPKR